MDTITIFKVIISIISVVIIVAIVLQTRAGGLGAIFGGSSGSDLYKSKRGFEAFLYNGTIILGILLVIACLALAIVSV
jgi:protein translocase SecG subunit